MVMMHMDYMEKMMMGCKEGSKGSMDVCLKNMMENKCKAKATDYGMTQDQCMMMGKQYKGLVITKMVMGKCMDARDPEECMDDFKEMMVDNC